MAIKRIAFLAGTLAKGGAEKQLRYIMKAALSLDFELRLYVFSQGEYWDQRLSDEGFDIVHLTTKSRILRLTRLFAVWREWRPDWVICQHFFVTPYAAFVGRLLRIPVCGAIRNNGFTEFGSLPKLITHSTVAASRLLVANSMHAINNLRQLNISEDKLFYLPNVIDRSVSSQPAREQSPVTVLCVARLAHQKRIDRALRIVAKTREAVGIATPIQLVIVGDGPQRSELMTLNDETGADAIFVGAKDDTIPWFQRAHILLLTSDHEGLPNVVLEAMSVGCAVLASNVGGVSEIVEDTVNGLIYEPNDEARAIQSLTKLVVCNDLRSQLAEGANQSLKRHQFSCLVTRFRALSALVDNSTKDVKRDSN